jgi:DNA-binding transcriptional regulator YdaS (Cro superfamily)|tara:strand:+ start:1409 stop:1651 length:243 start_codon:yes stop_codon:yes gene_type:complete
MKSAADIKQQQSKELMDLIKWIGGRARLANECEVTPQAVYEWVKRGRISAKGATIIHKKSQGFFKREELRPDVIVWSEEI